MKIFIEQCHKVIVVVWFEGLACVFVLSKLAFPEIHEATVSSYCLHFHDMSRVLISPSKLLSLSVDICEKISRSEEFHFGGSPFTRGWFISFYATLVHYLLPEVGLLKVRLNPHKIRLNQKTQKIRSRSKLIKLKSKSRSKVGKFRTRS